MHSEKSNYELNRKGEISAYSISLNESIGLLIIHRKRRSKEMFSSSLDGIVGLGPKLKIDLIRHFGGVNKVSEATLDDLRSAPGIGESKAKKIFYHLKNN